MMNPGKSERPLSPPEKAALVVLALFFGGMISVAVFQEFSIYKLSVPVFILSWAVLLLIHEFGHAIMAKIVGWEVEKVSIGTGKFLGTKTILGMKTEFRAIPLSGFVLPRPRDLVNPRLKNFLIYAAGPGIQLLLVAVIWMLLGTDTLLQREPVLWLVIVQSFCAAALFGALINLVPLPFQSDDGKMTPSDGLGMIVSWQITDKQFAEWIEKK